MHVAGHNDSDGFAKAKLQVFFFFTRAEFFFVGTEHSSNTVVWLRHAAAHMPAQSENITKRPLNETADPVLPATQMTPVPVGGGCY